MKQFFVNLQIVVLFLLVPSLNVSAQKNFIEGYIITLKKDTLKGLVDYREWNLNPTLIHFTDAAGNKNIFRPDDIAGFFIPPKDYYISSHVSLDLSSFQTKDLMEYEEPKLVRDTALFLMTLVKGEASLYYLNDRNNREHYYVSKAGAPLVELLLKKSYIKSSEGHTETHAYVATVKLFKGQLIVLFNDCPELKEKINNVTYSSESLIRLLTVYNNCIHSTMEFVKKEEPIKFKFGLLAGLTLTKISFKGGSNDLTDVKMSNCYSFLAGVSFQIIFPRERAQWILENELDYKPYNNSASISELSWTGDKYDKKFSFHMGYLKLYTLLRYQYPKWKIRPFADFGMSNGYAIQSSDTKTVVITYMGNNDKNTTTGPAIKDPKLYEFGILGGIGISWWKISGEVRYEWAQGMASQSGFSGSENTIYFVASFLF